MVKKVYLEKTYLVSVLTTQQEVLSLVTPPYCYINVVCQGEKPAAYIIMLGDKDISSNYFWDHGLACQSILLGACEKGLGGCMFGSIDRQGLKDSLSIPDKYEILLVIALGKPKEIVVLDELSDKGDIKYWRDENGIHHVPKRKLQDIILKL